MEPYFGLVKVVDPYKRTHAWTFVADEGEYPISNDLGDWWELRLQQNAITT